MKKMKLKFEITGMTCAACSARVEKVVRQLSGIQQAQVNLLANTLVVETDSESMASSVICAVEQAGYGARLFGESPKKENKPQNSQELREMKIRLIGSISCLVILMYFTMGHMIGLPAPSWYLGNENALVAALLQFFLTLPPIILNRIYFTKGIKNLINRAPNMESLIAVGSGASLLYGIVALFRMAYSLGHEQWEIVQSYRENLYFESAAMIVTLITLGKFLEARAKGKTGDALRKLMDLRPQKATVRRQDQIFEVSVEQVRVGDVVLVRSGGSIPVDGTVISGRGAVDQSTLTGESVPVEKGEGENVAAATILTEGYLEIRADRIGQDTTLSQVIRMVEEAGGSKAPIARLADKIAGVFVPAVMGIALITFTVWVLSGASVEFSLTNAISVLVISCPCALGLATPVAIMVGSGRGAQMGVLFKNAEALENLHRIDTVVLDKTGTLTEGKPVVTDILTITSSKDDLLDIACALESKSEHPFARAIINEFGTRNIQATEFETLPGQGISAIINNKRYYGGNRALMLQLGIGVPDYPELSGEGKTPLYFASNCGKCLGVIAVSDVLKSDSSEAVKVLRDQKLDVIMLTGDNERTARAIAQKAGIDHVIAQVLPTGKADVIYNLRHQGKKVLMVGDGINDAPALAGADVGMALGAGTDIAMESADIVLIGGSLKNICNALALSKATIRNIRQNLFWAFFYNCLGIPIAAGVLYPLFGILLSPMLGAAAMSMSSFFVVSNALRLRFFKEVIRQEIVQNNCMVQEVTTMATVLKVEGMMCPHCKARVESVCKAVPGTVDAVVDLEKKQVTITGEVKKEAWQKAITDAGYEVID